MKTCTKCKRTLPLSQFFADKRTKSGKMASCKSCKQELTRKWWLGKKQSGYHKARYQKIKVGERERHLVKKYGVDLARYQEMYSQQDGKCAICGRTQERSFDVDHDHSTGEVRGLLCTSCNKMIGHAGDNPERLMAAAEYLSSRRSQRSSSKRTCKPNTP